MIYESGTWKKELREKSQELIRNNTKKNFDRNFERACFTCERAIVYTALLVRVSIDSNKLSKK